MSNSFRKLSTAALQTLLSRETRKFIVAIEYGSTASDLSEIRETIKELQKELDSRASNTICKRRPIRMGETVGNTRVTEQRLSRIFCDQSD